MKIRTCKTCEETKEITEFRHHNNSSGKWIDGTCKSCKSRQTRQWQIENPEKWRRISRRTRLKQKFGLSVEKYNEMLESQGGNCKICRNKPTRRRLDVDHCHDTGKIRGLLCENCNKGLGIFKDDPELFDRAKKYLVST